MNKKHNFVCVCINILRVALLCGETNAQVCIGRSVDRWMDGWILCEVEILPLTVSTWNTNPTILSRVCVSLSVLATLPIDTASRVIR